MVEVELAKDEVDDDDDDDDITMRDLWILWCSSVTELVLSL